VITLNKFYQALATFRPQPNNEQRAIIESAAGEPLFIVAGPGTGKTASLTLRILKLILVDGIPPRGILATTFTKKAAAELRSRILGWGFRLLETLGADEAIDPETRAWLNRLDINQVLTGTIDSLCERVLRDYREPGTQPPILIDDFVAKTLLLRDGLFGTGRYDDAALDSYLLNLKGGSSWGWHVGAKNDLVQQIWDRRFHDQVAWDTFVAGGPLGEADARAALNEVVTAYQEALQADLLLDFALLEQEVLSRLRAGQLEAFLEQLQVVLVDEYQDTNLLQESLYLELARACGGALNVVGDDDQSLYRFRGATVELFSDFPNRYAAVFGRTPAPIFLQTNYRSVQRIFTFVNGYATLDGAYQAVRVAAKPPLSGPAGSPPGLPILAMFRDDVDTLAVDLAALIVDVFRGDGYTLPNGTHVRASPTEGDLGDCAFLCGSPAEYNAGGNPRLPLRLRQELNGRGIEVFNPRGQDLTSIPLVERFGGLLLECLDPGGLVADQTSGLNRDILDVFGAWRTAAINFVSGDDAPEGLMEYAVGWATRDPGRAGWQWPQSVPVLDLLYGLVHFFPALYDDAEGQIYLEVFTRQVSACEQVGRFSTRVITDPARSDLATASVKELMRDFLGPIASGTIKVNEELMEAFPRDRLSILSIHQAKGLEFPLTIVDAGSDFRTNHSAHAFKRFPRSGGVPHALEDLLRPYTPLDAPNRAAVDRAFDDLYRQYFVAYSRPEEILLVVGLNGTFPGGRILNVATGWDRGQNCVWAPIPPFVQI
jgi:DNA helicase-2/ATP-dependent DNA helicase PcrA